MATGCSKGWNIRTANDVVKHTTVYNDSYTGMRKIISPTITAYMGMFDFVHAKLIKVDGSIGLSIYYSAQPLAGGWKFFHSCYDINGTKLKTEELDRKVELGINEYLVVHLPINYLKDASETGLNLKLIGKRGSRIMKIPAYYIEGFLKIL